MRRLPLPAGKRGTRPGSRFAALGCLHLSRHTPSGRRRHVVAGGRGRSSRGAALECAGSGRDRFRARAGPKRTTIKYVRRARTRVRGGRRCIARRGSSSRGASTRFRRALRDHRPFALRVVRISLLRVCPLDDVSRALGLRDRQFFHRETAVTLTHRRSFLFFLRPRTDAGGVDVR